MYKKIMVPVDLAHVEVLGKAIDTATDLAKLYAIPVCFVGVTAETPTSVAHTPEEFARRLKAFGEKQAAAHGLTIETAAYPSHDPSVDLDKTLIAAAHETGADLVVMATHVPGVLKHIFSTQGAQVASHADVSVFLVR
ncbi:universal stress protein [Microbaculum marinisediminis]|uniref:Universal stress protein n=1 Tax=Microbaculum marinisediminis TaxID=2931392 RepID=A0AAW5QVS6_9HYPH|nr:universal stress protein [Microbaculum sp. A6E488]MCT8970483.1 universal stress protein [Microbaculum sp. A6E488]